MAYNTTVKFFHSGMAGAPSLTGTAGPFIAMLDACLKDGFGQQTATSLTVSGGIATLTVPSTHPFDVHTVVLVAGATPSGLNGEKRVLSSAANTITFDATGIADGTATGTITVKLAPAGWTKPFSGTNLAAYQSSNVASTKAYLRVDDTAAQNATVRAYETMSDVSTGTGPCPTLGQAANVYWCKANASGGAARPWIIVADDKTMWIKVCTVPSGSQNCGIIYGAGDFVSRKSGDAYSFVLFGSTADNSTVSSSPAANQYYGLAHIDYLGQSSGWIMRSYTGVGGAALAFKQNEEYCVPSATGLTTGAYESGAAGLVAYPNPVDNALLLTRYLCNESGVIRGSLRGPLYCPHTLPPSFTALTPIDGVGPLAGRKIAPVNGNTPNTSTFDNRTVFFDLTGPWS